MFCLRGNPAVPDPCAASGRSATDDGDKGQAQLDTASQSGASWFRTHLCFTLSSSPLASLTFSHSSLHYGYNTTRDTRLLGHVDRDGPIGCSLVQRSLLPLHLLPQSVACCGRRLCESRRITVTRICYADNTFHDAGVGHIWYSGLLPDSAQWNDMLKAVCWIRIRCVQRPLVTHRS
jgi:hypothetical protein